VAAQKSKKKAGLPQSLRSFPGDAV